MHKSLFSFNIPYIKNLLLKWDQLELPATDKNRTYFFPYWNTAVTLTTMFLYLYNMNPSVQNVTDVFQYRKMQVRFLSVVVSSSWSKLIYFRNNRLEIKKLIKKKTFLHCFILFYDMVSLFLTVGKHILSLWTFKEEKIPVTMSNRGACHE